MDSDLTTITGRISRPYADLSGVTHELATKVCRVLIVQHDADKEVNRDHIHVLFYESLVKQEAIKRLYKRITGLELKGNKDWSFVETLPTSDRSEFWNGDDPVCRNEEEIFKYIRYIIKGDRNNIKYVRNISDALITKALEDWEVKEKETKDPEKLFIIEKVKKMPYQQEVIAIASAEWFKYKKQLEDEGLGRSPSIGRLIEFVCDAMRQVSKGINPYIVKDIAYGIMYDDLDYRHIVLQKIQKIF